MRVLRWAAGGLGLFLITVVLLVVVIVGGQGALRQAAASCEPAAGPFPPGGRPVAGTISLVDVARVAFTAGWRRPDLVTAVAVAQAESGLRPSAVNAIGASGIWQVLPAAHPEFAAQWADGSWADPVTNARMAFRIWLAASRSWQPWETYTDGDYLSYLDGARQAVSAVGLDAAPRDVGGSSGTGTGAVAADQLDQCGPTAASGGGPNGVVYPFQVPGQAAGPDGWTQDQGVDISAACGTTLVAMAPGQIIGQGISGFGPFAPELLVTAGPLAGRTIYYGHVQADLAALGAQVDAGQPIAQIGDLGISFGCHLEIGISPPGAPPGTIPADHQTSQEMWDLLQGSLPRPASGS